MLIERGIEGVEVLTVQLISQQTKVLTEPLIMNNFSGSEEADRVDHIGIITEAQDVVIGGTRFLLP